MAFTLQNIALTRHAPQAPEDDDEVICYAANAITVTVAMTGADTFNGFTTARIQLLATPFPPVGEAPLADDENATPTTGSQSFSLTGPMMNQPASSAGNLYWLLATALHPTHGVINLARIRIRLLATAAAEITAAAPGGSPNLTQTAADALYEPLGGGGGAEFVDAPLSDFDDPRGAVGSHCYDATTGYLYTKVTSDPDPDAWVGVQTFNET